MDTDQINHCEICSIYWIPGPPECPMCKLTEELKKATTKPKPKPKAPKPKKK